jgi:hypothetical protein
MMGVNQGLKIDTTFFGGNRGFSHMEWWAFFVLLLGFA